MDSLFSKRCKMKKYKVEIVIAQKVVSTFEFDNVEEANLCYYVNESKVTQYTRLYVDGEEIKGMKSIKSAIGNKPRKLWQINLNP